MSELKRAEEQVIAAKRRINCAFPRSNDGGEGEEEFRRAIRDLVDAQERFWEIESGRAAGDEPPRSNSRRPLK